jgi:hypothetical protein
MVEGMATQGREQREWKRTEATHTGGQVLKGERRDKKELGRARERDPRAIANPTHKTYNTSPAQTHTHTHTHHKRRLLAWSTNKLENWTDRYTTGRQVGRWDALKIDVTTH